jgi:hypothetical protein
MDDTIRELTPLCGRSRKLQKQKREFIRVFGEWTLSTHVQIWLKDEMVHAYSFLRRSDSEPHHWGGEWSSRIDSLILLGVSASDFPFVGESHETLCAKSLRAPVEMFIPSVPKLIEGLPSRLPHHLTCGSASGGSGQINGSRVKLRIEALNEMGSRAKDAFPALSEQLKQKPGPNDWDRQQD